MMVTSTNGTDGNTMTTLRLDYVHAYKDRHGKLRYFYRRRGRKTVLRGRPGEADFMESYAEAAAKFTNAGPSIAKPPATGTVAALVALYYASPEWLTLRDSTRRTYRGIVDRWKGEHGSKRVRMLERRHIAEQVAKSFQDSGPHAANRLLYMLRLLMRFAVASDFRRDDPTIGVRPLRATSGGFVSWSEDDIAKFEARWPKGTRERLAMALLLYTGQRRGDVVRMGRQHITGDCIRVVQNKTGARLTIPLHAELRAAIADTPKEHMTILTTGKGASFSAAGFGNWFREACDGAGLKDRSAHGLRKAAARRLAEAGCSVLEIASITGHRTLQEVARYTAAADQERMARTALGRIKPKARTKNT